jgi:outer membrane receptor protein involved in Fe transport
MSPLPERPLPPSHNARTTLAVITALAAALAAGRASAAAKPDAPYSQLELAAASSTATVDARPLNLTVRPARALRSTPDATTNSPDELGDPGVHILRSSTVEHGPEGLTPAVKTVGLAVHF